MTVMTDDEVLAFLEKNKWNHGIGAIGNGERHLHYPDAEERQIRLKRPDTPLRTAYFARVVAMLGIEEESQFMGGLLWITLWSIGSAGLEKAGWKIIDRMRQGYGENRPLEAARGHWFRPDELTDLCAFLIPCFVFAWDAYVVPSGSRDFFVYLTHHDDWFVITRTQEAYDRYSRELAELRAD